MKGESLMKNRKRLLLAIALVVVAAGSLTSWAMARASTKREPVNTKYLQAFFDRYVAALNSKNAKDTEPFYSPNAVTVGAWGIEMTAQTRTDYLECCKEAFPAAQISVKSITIDAKSETSGNITWEFGIKAGRQAAPFLGVWTRVDSEPEACPDGTVAYDQEGYSVAEVEAIDQVSAEAINGYGQQIAALDKEILSLDGQISAANNSEKTAIAERRSELAAKRASIDQEMFDQVVASIKFTRQTSFQNMDRFLKKLNGQ
jgi:hypothetical protein